MGYKIVYAVDIKVYTNDPTDPTSYIRQITRCRLLSEYEEALQIFTPSGGGSVDYPYTGEPS